MLLTNTTFVTSTRHAEALAAWLTEVYVPHAASVGCYTDILPLRILTGVADDTVSYAVQMRCATVAEAKAWDDTHAPQLYERLIRLFGEQGVLHFTTHMRML